MQQTTNLELNKFDSTDLLEATTRVGLNDNFDILDNAFSGITASIGTVEGEISTLQNTKADTAAVATALSTKANIDGYYESLTAGNSLQLLSDISVTDKVPYLFRTAGGSLNIGNRETDKIVGGTVNFNQLQANTTSNTESGATFTYSNGKLTVTTQEGGVTANALWLLNTATKWNFIAGHKYLVDVGNPDYVGSNSTYKWAIATSRTGSSVSIVKPQTIVEFDTDTTRFLNFVIYSGQTFNGEFVPQVFDLTATLGTTIANYIYTLEQGTAGAGVTWATTHFPFLTKNNPYNAGTLMSVKTSAHKTTGFNQWDEEWESGIINSQGDKSDGSNFLRTKNYVPVFASTGYYFKIPNTRLYIAEYDINKTFISRTVYATQSTGKSFTMSANTHYVMFCFGGEENPQTSYGNNVCLNLAWDGERNGEYEPYVEHTYALDDVELRGIPKLDASNNLYYDGDTYESDGTVTREYDIVDLGTLTYTKYTSGDNYNYYAPMPTKANNTDMVCSGLVFGGNYSGANGALSAPNNSISGFNNTGSSDHWVYVRMDDYTTAAAVKTALSGVYLVYELTTPTTETADPYTNPQIVDDWGTEEYIDERTIPIPVGHETQYPANLKAKLEMLPDSPNGNGLYGLRQTSGINSWELLTKELPSAPLTDGNYILKCTVSGGTSTLTWEEQV